jgi:hypothetical protein
MASRSKYPLGLATLIASKHAEVNAYYSYLSATIGSTLEARRAGMNPAKAEMAMSRIETVAKVSGSAGPTP